MANLDEIFAAMPAATAEDDREYLVIDPVTRTISVPESERVFGVTGDELADRKYFMCPRYVGDDLDLAGMFIRVNYRNAGGDEDGYLVEDVAVVGDYVTFSWRLWPKVTEYKGAIQFSVCADLPNTTERKFPDWNTTMASGEVLEGLHPYDGAVEEETRDVVTQLRAETAAQTAAVEACGAEQVQAVKDTAADETAASVAAIKAQGAATQASLPADYTALAAQVDKLTRDRAAAIVCQAEGAAIQVQDASNDPLQGLRIFGRSTQDGTPTPDNPVEIVSTHAPGVSVCGKNLANMVCHSGENNYIALVNAEDLRAVKKGKQYTLSVYLHATGATRAYWNNAAKLYGYLEFDVAAGTNRYTYSFTAWDDGALYETVSNIVNKYPANDGVVVTASNAQLELGDMATEYEPYTGQALTITTPGSLPGTPVASGGNYTDAAGQQWIADEVDLARGVYIQRVTKRTITDFSASSNYMRAGDFTEGNIWLDANLLYATGLCDRFEYAANGAKERFAALGSGAVYFVISGELTQEEWRNRMAELAPTIVLALKNPVETPLSDAEIQAYRALHSNKPTTTVLNDAGAHMVLEYAADPKTYIDNKLAALIAANN